MWVDDQGVCHTVALRDPSAIMSAAFRRSLDALQKHATEEVAEAIEVEELHFYEARKRLTADAASTEQVGCACFGPCC